MRSYLASWVNTLGQRLAQGFATNFQWIFTQSGYLTDDGGTNVILDASGNKFVYFQR